MKNDNQTPQRITPANPPQWAQQLEDDIVDIAGTTAVDHLDIFRASVRKLIARHAPTVPPTPDGGALREALEPTAAEFMAWAKDAGFPVGTWNASDAASFYTFFLHGFKAVSALAATPAATREADPKHVIAEVVDRVFYEYGQADGRNLDFRNAIILALEEAGILPRATPAATPGDVLFQSAVSGLWYSRIGAAGDISAIKVGEAVFQVEPPTGPGDTQTGTPTPRTNIIAKRIGSIIARLQAKDVTLPQAADLIDEELNAARTLERDLATARKELEEARASFGAAIDGYRETVNDLRAALATANAEAERLREAVQGVLTDVEWIAKRGWNPMGTVEENSRLSYDCHCVAAGVLTKLRAALAARKGTTT